MKNKRFLVFAVCYLSYMAIYAARINLSTSAPELKQLSILTSAQLGMLGSAFSIVYATGRLINGALSDRIRPSIMIVTSLLITGCCNILFPLQQSFAGLLLFWIINAYGQSMLWSSLLCVMSAVYEKDAVKKASSYLVTSVASGNIAAILLTLFLISRYNVKWAFIIPGLISIVLGGLCLYVIGKVDTSQKALPIQSKKAVINKGERSGLIAALIPTLCHGAVKDNVTLWMSVIAVELCGIELADSARFVLLIPVIGLLGRILYPFFYSLCKNREHILSCGAFFACIPASAILLLFARKPLPAMLALGTIYAASSMINTSMVSIYPARFAACGHLASVSGLMDFATYLGAGLGSLIYGVLVERHGYVPMFTSWILISMISIGVLLCLQFKFEKAEDKNESCY